MDNLQHAAYARGYADREAGREMVESWKLSPRVSNAYRNGYVDATYDAEHGEGAATNLRENGGVL